MRSDWGDHAHLLCLSTTGMWRRPLSESWWTSSAPAWRRCRWGRLGRDLADDFGFPTIRPGWRRRKPWSRTARPAAVVSSSWRRKSATVIPITRPEAVDHGQGLDLVAGSGFQALLQFGGEFDADHVAGHDVAAGEPEVAFEGGPRPGCRW